MREGFRAFFRSLWGYDPYPWQEALLEWALEGKWPEVVALPTGSGKTAALDVAVFLMAVNPKAHRRVVYVVNRRVVVDQAEARARRLAERLEMASSEDGPLAEVAQALRRLGGGVPLRVVKLRGGLPLPRHPIPDPAAPTVVLSTLDQVGSRLLFRGYGLSPRAWPVEAGLLGVDSLFLLDEAHLEGPAFAILRALERRLKEAEKHLGRPSLRVVALTATPEPLPGIRCRLDPSEADEKRLAGRWGVRKPFALHKVTAKELAERMAQEARALRQQTEGPVLVFANRVGTARAVFQELAGEGALLLTGRIRPFDRDRLLREDLQKRLDQGEVAYVVATQALEVGADLDFSALITELAPLAALFQRLGRVGRRGLRREAPVAIFFAEDAPPYPYPQDSLKDAWDWLKAWEEKVGDLGIAALRGHLGRFPPEKGAWGAFREDLPVPPGLLDLYALTDPHVEALQAEPLLHGVEPERPEVYLAFRKDLSAELLAQWPSELGDFFPLPSAYELLPLPYPTALAFLEGVRAEASDLEGEGEGEDEGEGTREVRVLRLGEEGWEPIGAKEVRPGDTLLVPAGLGGLDAYGWNPKAREPVRDVAEARPPGASPPWILRLHPEVLWDALREGARTEAERERLQRALEGLKEVALNRKEDPLEALEAARATASLLGVPPPKGNDLDRWLREAVRVLLEDLRNKVEPEWEAAYGAALEGLGKARLLAHPDYGGLALRLRGETLSLGGAAPEGLEEHQEKVAGVLRDFLGRLDLKKNLAPHMKKAARKHDLGKLDPRFQTWLRLTAPAEELPSGPLAKSGTRMGPRAVGAMRQKAGYPPGQRHELVGAASLRAAPLVRHLVATHHGHARPFPQPPQGEDQEEVKVKRLRLKTRHGLERLASGYAEGFLELFSRYTPWGLAYLEALLRLADQGASGEVSYED
jgi:CRISPR-associated endonuclease/helicase Cas3